MNLERFGITPLILLYMVFPLTFSISKMGMMYAPPTTFVAFRMTIAGLVLLAVFALQHKGRFYLDLTDSWLFIRAGLFGIYLTYVPELWALQYLSVAKSAFLFVLAPFFTALFSKLYENESFSTQKLIGLLIGLIGFIPMLIATSSGEESFQSFFIFNLPEVITMLAVAAYAYSWIPIKELMNKKEYSPWLINGVSMLGGGIGAGITSFFWDGWYRGYIPVTNWFMFSKYIVYILFVGIFCYILYTYLLKNFSTTLVSFFCFTEPFFAAFYGWVFLGELVSPWFFVSIFIVSFGLYIFYRSELSQERES